jgi:uncharacterized membrane protein
MWAMRWTAGCSNVRAMAAPFEYVIIGFPENNFTGEIAEELAKLVDSGTIRLVDVVFVSRGDDGSLLAVEVDEDERLSAFLAIDGEIGGVISQDDIEHAAGAIEAGSSVLMIMWEDIWATPVVNAIARAGGELIEGARIPAELAEIIDDVLAEAG